MKTKIIVILVLVVIFLILLMQNSYEVSLRFLFWEITISQILLLALTMTAGYVIGFLIAVIAVRKKKQLD